MFLVVCLGDGVVLKIHSAIARLANAGGRIDVPKSCAEAIRQLADAIVTEGQLLEVGHWRLVGAVASHAQSIRQRVDDVPVGYDLLQRRTLHDGGRQSSETIGREVELLQRLHASARHA
eukprot:CAMPEP_0198131360 /NCGR_PEP_ID=MMETSP1442-20131203/56028_1 /TAXON_ID= /ORGANISM="Craspedostauros australis, Strain CCMP3328" /LENGTH=118 /DNA_ID=CAMNT_0043792159 /DNA_START=136 /DNA_END=488 /DNA_ORIENTATION=-